MNLVIDIGNTKVKAAVFELDTIKGAYVFDEIHLFNQLEDILEKHEITHCILSSVKETREDFLQELQKIPFFILLDATTKVPLKNLYSTPTTLGIDRIALAAAAVSLYPQKNSLIIDAGTCITYDFINLKSEYLGGAISPGIDVRYQSLHHYTSKLPKLIKSEVHNLVGTSTSEAIHSGVINGVIHEIEGVIRQYELDFHDLTVVLTGGDTKFLFKQLKNSIFANQNFLLHGLNKILTFNNQ
jgi:type III pantothenate kinase